MPEDEETPLDEDSDPELDCEEEEPEDEEADPEDAEPVPDDLLMTWPEPFAEVGGWLVLDDGWLVAELELPDVPLLTPRPDE